MREALLFLLLAGCWSSTPAERPLSSAVVVEQNEPLASIAGRWRGEGYQPDADSSWTIVMTLRSDAAVGEKVGTIEYPSLGCSGELIRTASQPDEIRALERLTINPPDSCVDGGTIVVPTTPRTDGRLVWTWFYPDGQQGATATLAR